MMEKIIKAAVDRGASDLHIKAGDVFRARIHGELVALTKQSLTPEQTKAIALHLMSNEDDKTRIDQILDYDCSWAAPGIGRFRVNIMKQRGSFSIIMRVIPWDVPNFDQLGLPPVLSRIASAERGMILVTGVTGSGKSSTMAALIKYINERESRHILTLENPIEFLHRDSKSSVTQREVGSDTSDFKMGLRAALRQDPDVIMIGEMRDAETVDTAIKAAETGHLLMSTLHTPDAQSTILRIVAMFPPEEQDIIRIRLAESLYAVISQRLLPRKSGKGRAVAAEIMINTPSIKDLILEGTRIGEIRDFIATGREQYGMQTFDQCLADLVKSGEVTFDTAKAAASNPSDFELQMRMFSQTVTDEEAAAPSTPAAGVGELDGLQSGTLDFI
ncbi:MAG TPA: type IV pilus twitching motility protein PilT [Gemmatimonadaceae bacterium]|jgi:twitching motility protein PilT|nr:type IV pilus twitching motility protein PilT [Gemmatimonadaceae bacterium]